MNLCQAHWDKLRTAIDDRGLTRFVAKSGEAAAQQIVDQLNQIAEGKGDPLMNAAMAIFNNALSAVGLGLLNPGEDGKPPCPICVLKTCGCGDPTCADRFENWINRAADDQRDLFADQIASA